MHAIVIVMMTTTMMTNKTDSYKNAAQVTPPG